jgi:hypothetical protein
MDYEKIIDELIEKKLQAALAELDKKREQTTAAYAQKKETAKAEREDLTRGAYADYAKNLDPGGIEAEKMAARGLKDSGKTETAKVGYYNVYQNMLAAIRNKTDEELQNLSEQEQKALTALDEADTKARDNAYTLLMEEQIRRQEAAAKQAEADRQYQLKLAAQAAKKTTAKTEVVGYPVNGTEKEKYNWLKRELSALAWSVSPDEDNPRNRILAQSKKYLDLAYRDLSTTNYSKLLDIVV